MNEAEIKEVAELSAIKHANWHWPSDAASGKDCTMNREYCKESFKSGFIAGAEANAPKWTLCTDALPDPESRVFVLANKGKNEYGNCFIMYYGLIEDDRMGWILDGDVVKQYMTPTHWMPLPSPPNTQP